MRISKKIPIPQNNPQGRKPKYPWRTMNIGESFLAVGKKVTDVSTMLSRYPGKKFMSRTVKEGVRVWRVE